MTSKFDKLRNAVLSSIRLKMLLYIGAPILLVVIILVSGSILYFLGRSETQVKEVQLAQMELTLQRVSDVFLSLESIARRTAELLNRNPDTENSTLYTLVETNVITSDLVYGSTIAFEPDAFPDRPDHFSPYAYRNDNSVAVRDIGTLAGDSSYDYADGSHDWYEIPRKNGTGSWINPFADSRTGNIVLSAYSTPLFRNNNFAGVCTVEIEPDSLFLDLDLNPVNEYIIDYNDRNLFSPLTENGEPGGLFTLNKNINSSDLKELLAASRSSPAGVFELESLSGDSIWALHSVIPQTGWLYINLISASTAMQSTYEQLYLNIGITTVSIFSLILLIWHITNLITKPISKLHDITERASHGEYIAAFKLPGNDEISRLGLMLGKMFDVVRQKSEELEDKVRQRTRKLEYLETESTRQRNLMESALNGVGTGIIMYDRDLKILAANLKFWQLIGLEKSEWEKTDIGKITDILSQSIFKKDFNLALAKRRLSLEENFTVAIELKFGQVVEIKHAPLRGGGGFIRTFEDITIRHRQQEQLDRRLIELEEARKASMNMMRDAEEARQKIHESQQLLEGFIDNSAAVIYVKDKDGQYLLVNKEWERVTNISRSETIGRCDLELFDNNKSENMVLRDKEVMKSRKPMQFDEPLVEGKTYLTVKFPLYDISGEVNGVAGISTNITEQKLLEEELRIAKAKAEEAAKAKTNFLASMSHEIRTPMNVVIGMVDLLGQTSMSSDQMHMLQAIASSGHSLLTIINDILDFSKLEAGRLTLESIPLQITNTVEDATRTVAVNIQNKDLRLITFIAPELPYFVCGDVVRLRQILINLVGNAIKFTDHGTIKITVEETSRSEGEICIRLAVQDPGIGISASAQQQLFTAFTQAESSTTRKYGGTGLGLTICERLTTMMGGSIRVKSNLGEGSTFTVELPFKICDKMPEDKPADLSGLHILLVSDDDFECYVIQHYLEHWQAKVSVINSLESFITQCQHERDSGNPLSLAVIGSAWDMDESLACQIAAGETGLPRLKFVKLLQSKRENIHAENNEWIVVDSNPFKRAELLTAVAVCADRASPEIHYREAVEIIKPDRPLLSVEEARAAGTLILVAEDNPTNRDVIGRQLKVLGYTCEMAEDGAQALQAWQSGNYGLLLTDCHMPNMDGFELTDRIRKFEHESGSTTRFPIVAVTANALYGEAENCLAAGMDDYLSKPLSMKELAKALQHWLPGAVSSNSAPVTESHNRVSSMTDNSDQPENDPDESLLDLSLLKGILGDDPVEIQEVLDGFVKSSSATLSDISEAYAKGDFQSVSISAHKLKSAAKYVGAIELADICYALEIAGKSSDRKTLDNEVSRIKPIFQAVVQAIQNIGK